MLIPRHGDPYTQPHRIDHAANLRRLVEPAATACSRSARSARCGRELGVGHVRLPRRLHRPPPRRLDLRRRPRPPARRASTPAGAAHVVDAWASGARRRCATAASTGRRIGPALRDPGRDPDDRRARRRGRHDDRLRVRRSPASSGFATRRSASSTTWPTESARATLSVEELEAGRAREPRERPRAPPWPRSFPELSQGGSVSLTVDQRAARRRERRAALRGRRDRGDRPRRRGPAPGDEMIDAGGAPIWSPAAGQRPHPRGDDPVPRLRRRPAADALAAGEDLAGRGEARRRGRLLGHAPRLRGDDPHRHGPLLGHVLARRGDRAGGRRRGPAGDGSAAPLFDGRPAGPDAVARDGGPGARRDRGGARERSPPPRAALDLHGQRGALRWIAENAGGARPPDPPPPPRPSDEVDRLPRAHGVRPADTSTRLGAPRPDARCSPTASGSTTRALGAGRGARRHRGHQPGREPEARRRPRVSLLAARRTPPGRGGIGTDGAGSNDSLDLLQDLKSLALHPAARRAATRRLPRRRRVGHRHRRGAPRARRRRAGIADPAPADFLLVRERRPRARPRRPRRRPRLRGVRRRSSTRPWSPAGC